MSWSLSIPAHESREELLSAIEHVEPEHEVTEDAEEQMRVAKEAAAAIVNSGAVGGDEPLTVSLNGHSNPDHKPEGGSPFDTISVSVSQTVVAKGR